MPDQLADAPELPELVAHVWEAFCELSRCRGGNGAGPNPITPTAIKDWSEIMGVRMDAWEIKLLLRLDREYLAEVMK